MVSRSPIFAEILRKRPKELTAGLILISIVLSERNFHPPQECPAAPDQALRAGRLR